MRYILRIDKFLSVTGTCSRADAKRAIRGKGVSVNGCIVKNADAQVDENGDEILFFGKKIIYRQ